MKRLVVLLGVVVVSGCSRSQGASDGGPVVKAPRAPARGFEPLERVPLQDAGAEDPREAMYRVAPFAPAGLPVPEGAVRVELRGELAVVNGAAFDVAAAKPEVPVVLVPDADVYLVQASGLLAKLDDAGFQVWFKHPDSDFAYPVKLRDEPAFQAWLDEAAPGKVRVIHRADGFELQTNMGKLPGADPNGPTVPVRGGKMDLATLQKGLGRVQGRFKDAPDWCLVPSFGMPLADVARAMASDYARADSTFFAQTCLVYPRPKVRDAGK